MKSIGFTGTQHGMTSAQKKSLKRLLKQFAWADEFHHGDCIGADAQADAIARSLNYKIAIHPPAQTRYVSNSKRAYCFQEGDKQYSPRDYLKRNVDIVKASRVVIGAPKQFKEVQRSGTWATLRAARRRNKQVYIILPDGTPGTMKQLSRPQGAGTSFFKEWEHVIKGT